MPPPTAPPQVLAFNAMIAETTRDLPAIWDVGIEAARASREAGASVFGTIEVSSRAETFSIDSPSGPVAMRTIRPRGEVRGVYLHLHGGGWALGAPHHGDVRSEQLADATGLVVVAPTYRLAPEFRYPAAPDDCEAAALWLLENAAETYGTSVLTLGGESAGAHLAMVTALRLRNRLGSCPFVAAAYMYGIYDLRGTPSCLNFGDRPLILNSVTTNWFISEFAGDIDLTNPDLSPMFADVSGLPPALFLCGDVDPLIDDTLFMETKYRTAGNHTTLEIWPGGIHAFDYFDNDYGLAARRSIHEFLNGTIAIA